MQKTHPSFDVRRQWDYDGGGMAIVIGSGVMAELAIAVAAAVEKIVALVLTVAYDNGGRAVVVVVMTMAVCGGGERRC
jgi:hypothetical protein